MMRALQKIIFAVLVLIIITIICACASQSKAEKVAEIFLKACNDNDIATLMEVIEPEYHDDLTKGILLQTSLLALVGGGGGEYTELKLKTIFNDGKDAKIEYEGKLKVSTLGTSMIYPTNGYVFLTKKGGSWYVVPDVEDNAPQSLQEKAFPSDSARPQSIGNLEIGDRVVDNSWEWEFRLGWNYTGTGVTKPITWIIVAKDHYGEGSGITLLSEVVIGLHAFDDRSNHWGDSGTHDPTRGIRLWLNSTGIHAGEGFYHSFSDTLKSGILTTTVPNREWKNGVSYTTVDKVFLPSTTELGDTELKKTYEIGAVYPYFVGAAREDRIARLPRSGDSRYWTRSPVYGRSCPVKEVSSLGNFGYWGSYYFGGVRPAFNLSPETLISGIPNEDGVYEIQHSQ